MTSTRLPGKVCLESKIKNGDILIDKKIKTSNIDCYNKKLDKR